MGKSRKQEVKRAGKTQAKKVSAEGLSSRKRGTSGKAAMSIESMAGEKVQHLLELHKLQGALLVGLQKELAIP